MKHLDHAEQAQVGCAELGRAENLGHAELELLGCSELGRKKDCKEDLGYVKQEL